MKLFLSLFLFFKSSFHKINLVLTERSTYDGYGRPLAVYTPYDTFTGGIPAVRYSYEKDRAGNLLARTFNKVSTDSTDTQTIDTLIRIDGLGRPIYNAKSGFITTTGGISQFGWNVSGALEYVTVNLTRPDNI